MRTVAGLLAFASTFARFTIGPCKPRRYVARACLGTPRTSLSRVSSVAGRRDLFGIGLSRPRARRAPARAARAEPARGAREPRQTQRDREQRVHQRPAAGRRRRAAGRGTGRCAPCEPCAAAGAACRCGPCAPHIIPSTRYLDHPTCTSDRLRNGHLDERQKSKSYNPHETAGSGLVLWSAPCCGSCCEGVVELLTTARSAAV